MNTRRTSDMFTFRVGCLKTLILLVLVLVFLLVGLQFATDPFRTMTRAQNARHPLLIKDKSAKPTSGSCFVKKSCPDDQFSFYMKSGAANVVGPIICIQNKMVLGTILNNVGSGMNIVVIDGKTGAVQSMDHFNMYMGDIEPLITFLKNIKETSVVLIASFDEPSSKLNEEIRNLIAEMGSSSIKSMGYRDNWLFVGVKGTGQKSNFEKHKKSDHATNKYDGWPELIEMDGCIPKFLE